MLKCVICCVLVCKCMYECENVLFAIFCHLFLLSSVLNNFH